MSGLAFSNIAFVNMGFIGDSLFVIQGVTSTLAIEASVLMNSLANCVVKSLAFMVVRKLNLKKIKKNYKNIKYIFIKISNCNW